MNHVSHAPVSRPFLPASAAALAAVLLAHLVGWGIGRYLLLSAPVPDADIGAGMALILLPMPLAAVLAWPMALLTRLPRPGVTALIAAPPHLVVSGAVYLLWIEVEDHTVPGTLPAVAGSVWALAVAEALVLASVLTLAAWTVRRRDS